MKKTILLLILFLCSLFNTQKTDLLIAVVKNNKVLCGKKLDAAKVNFQKLSDEKVFLLGVNDKGFTGVAFGMLKKEGILNDCIEQKIGMIKKAGVLFYDILYSIFDYGNSGIVFVGKVISKTLYKTEMNC